ncbi:MAG: glycosyltransferase, partial [Pseudomonadota bacterium]
GGGEGSEPPLDDGHPRVFCFGGSQGARAVNKLMVDAAIELRAAGMELAIVHQTGKDDCAAVAERYRAAGIGADVREFIDDMASEYARADLVVSRSGATTVAELTIMGRPAILIPFPSAADDHQTSNAAELVAAGAALVLKQADIDGAKLAAVIGSLAQDPDRLEQMGAAMRSLGRPGAAAAIVDWLEQAKR